jgi:hypothetical protein
VLGGVNVGDEAIVDTPVGLKDGAAVRAAKS